MKISELNSAEVTTIPLVVTAATAKKTKKGNPYLTIDFFDGTDHISGNYWDWAGKNIPEKNTILDVTAQLTEYMGVPQLNIKSITTNTDMSLAAFTPTGGTNIEQAYKDAYELLSTLSNDFLRDLSLEILTNLAPLWITVPGASTVHHAYTGGTLIHSLSVAKMAKVLAIEMNANVDLCIAGGFLHDLGKLYCYKINGIVCEMTDDGILQDHIFTGANFISNFASSMVPDEKSEEILNLLVHIILSHHGKREYGATVPPALLEAHIVHEADTLDAIAEQIRVASEKSQGKFTERIWTLDNMAQITTQYTASLFKET